MAKDEKLKDKEIYIFARVWKITKEGHKVDMNAHALNREWKETRDDGELDRKVEKLWD